MVLEQSLTGRPRERAKAHAIATRPHVCEMCGLPIDMQADRQRDPLACTVDEWFPRKPRDGSPGGSALDPDNTVLMHRHCNGSKWNRWPVTPEMRERCRRKITELYEARKPTIRPF